MIVCYCCCQPTSVTELFVDHNQVVKMSLFRAYVAYRLRNIAVLNGVRVADAERLKGHRMFSDGFGLSPSVGGVPLAVGGQRTGRSGAGRRRSSSGGGGQDGFGGASKSGASIKAAGLSSSSSSLSSAAAYRQRHATFGIAYTSTLIEQAAEVERKVQSVDDMWPGLVQRVIKETLDGMARRKEVVTAAHNRWAAGGGGRERGGGGRKTGTTHSVSGGKGKNGGSSASSVNRGSSGDRSGSKNKSGSYFA